MFAFWLKGSSVYSTSYVKTTVDAWKVAKAPAATEARLITFEDLTENLGFELQQVDPTSQGYEYTANTPSWVYNSQYNYWTMSQDNDSASYVWYVGSGGSLYNGDVGYYGNDYNVVRPVITISKSSI